MNLVLEVLQRREVFRAVGVEQIRRHHYLVEEVPCAVVEERALALLCEQVVPRVVHVVLARLLDGRLARERLGHRLVGRVVVHVAHHEHLALLVGTQQRVLHGAHLSACHLAIVGRGEAAGPVAHDYGYRLAGESAAHGEESACDEVGVLRLFGHVWHEAHVLHGEEAWVVEHGAVDAAAVGSLYVYIFISALLQRSLRCEVVEHLRVLHLRHAYYGAADARQLVGAKVGDSLRHVAQLVGVLQSVPLVRAVGQEVIVALALVVASVEEILLVVETYSVEIKLFLSRCSESDAEEQGEDKKILFHFSYLLFYSCFV